MILRIFIVQSSKTDLSECHKKYYTIFFIISCYFKNKSMFLFLVAVFFLIMATYVHIIRREIKWIFFVNYITLNNTDKLDIIS